MKRRVCREELVTDHLAPYNAALRARKATDERCAGRRQEHPLKKQGVCAGPSVGRMLAHRRRLKDKFPDWEPARGEPYENVENIRPETQAVVELWKETYGVALHLITGVKSQGN